jgi:hypothetical protein
MKKYLSICIAVLLFMSCKHSITNESGFKIIVNVHDKLDLNKFKYIKGDSKGEFYSVDINLYNDADTASDVVTMSCTWQENNIFNNAGLFLLNDSICRNNFPSPTKIQSKQTKTFQGVIWVSDSLMASNNNNLKLGFIVIRKQEISYSIEFKDLLKNKIENKQDIIWSNPIEFNR